jgi:hypothetical protein
MIARGAWLLLLAAMCATRVEAQSCQAIMQQLLSVALTLREHFVLKTITIAIV